MFENSKIKKVHVVFMTHFDMGFTDYAENIVNRYMEEFIPDAIDLAAEMNQNGEKKFIWTIGAFLIANYLKTADKEGEEKLCAAIERGDICWHGLAFTTHTELMDRSLMDFDLSYSDKLDQRFGIHTTSAKLTDVPGHTKAIIGEMAAHGKKYLHIGVNASSMVPKVPDSFLWKSGNHELIVQYSPVYGSTCYVSGMDQVLEFVFLGDNLGLPTRSDILESFQTLKEKYPDAEVFASTLDAYAKELWLQKDLLPVLKEEIGDSWIHGTASDPCKVRRLKRLMTLKDEWLKKGKLTAGQPEYEEFMESLLMVCEHTWALDYKKYLFDFKNWTKTDFNDARKADDVTEELFTPRNADLLNAVYKEKGVDHLSSSYRAYERSYTEQRDYLEHGISLLPMSLQEEVQEQERQLEQRMADRLEHGEPYYIGQTITIGNWNAAFDGTGAITFLQKSGKTWIQNGFFGRFSYETYSIRDAVSEYYQYNHAFKENMTWSEADFSKPGMETVESLEHRNYPFSVMSILKSGNVVELELLGNGFAASEYGCPARACVRYTFGDEIGCELIWSQKDANKMLEALWFDFNLDVENPCLWEMIIMGENISPLSVVRGGNRRQHCVEALSYDGADGTIHIKNTDSPLVSAGGRRLFGGCLELPDLSRGFSYCLFNNKWGTNFPMWCADDGYFQYHIAIDNK